MCDWKGWYEQSGRQYEMTFQEFDVSCETVKGKGSDAVGVFEITGYCETANGIQFLKHYKGAHTVLYNGTLDPDEQVITGHWSIGDYIGEPFKIYKVNKKESKRRWKGFYLQNGGKYEMAFKSLEITQGKINCMEVGTTFLSTTFHTTIIKLYGARSSTSASRNSGPAPSDMAPDIYRRH